MPPRAFARKGVRGRRCRNPAGSPYGPRQGDVAVRSREIRRRHGAPRHHKARASERPRANGEDPRVEARCRCSGRLRPDTQEAASRLASLRLRQLSLFASPQVPWRGPCRRRTRGGREDDGRHRDEDGRRSRRRPDNAPELRADIPRHDGRPAHGRPRDCRRRRACKGASASRRERASPRGQAGRGLRYLCAQAKED